jgi:hypothetical protein
MSTVIGFFATRTDLLDLFMKIEANRTIHLAEAGMLDQADLVVYPSASQILGLGEIRVHESVQGRILLITDVAIPFVNEPVPQRCGGMRYSVSQKANPNTISLAPGGQFDDHTILAGNFGTCTDSPLSAVLLKLVAGAIRRNWTGIKSYAVGPEATRVLDAGGRLTANLRSPREFDLQR